MNVCILIGHLAKDPDFSTTISGKSRVSLRLAVQRPYANADGQREADFFNITAWDKSAEYARDYLAKGMRIAVHGSIQTRSYQAQDGSTRYITEISAQRIENLTPRSDNAAEPPKRDEFTPVDDDDLPF